MLLVIYLKMFKFRNKIEFIVKQSLKTLIVYCYE